MFPTTNTCFSFRDGFFSSITLLNGGFYSKPMCFWEGSYSFGCDDISWLPPLGFALPSCFLGQQMEIDESHLTTLYAGCLCVNLNGRNADPAISAGKHWPRSQISGPWVLKLSMWNLFLVHLILRLGVHPQSCLEWFLLVSHHFRLRSLSFPEIPRLPSKYSYTLLDHSYITPLTIRMWISSTVQHALGRVK